MRLRYRRQYSRCCQKPLARPTAWNTGRGPDVLHLLLLWDCTFARGNAPGGIRTPDRRIRNPLLYPTELRAQNVGEMASRRSLQPTILFRTTVAIRPTPYVLSTLLPAARSRKVQNTLVSAERSSHMGTPEETPHDVAANEMRLTPGGAIRGRLRSSGRDTHSSRRRQFDPGPWPGSPWRRQGQCHRRRRRPATRSGSAHRPRCCPTC